MAASSTEKHSVAVSVRIRPDGYSAEPCPGGIAQTNCIPAGDDSGILALAARINHS